MPKFEIKKFKSQRGHEGPGYACELWMDDKLAAHCYDEGRGGSPLVQYVSGDVGRQIRQHILTMPPYHWEKSKWEEAHDSPMDEELFMLQLVCAFETQKTYIRQCKKQTLIRLKTDTPTQYHIYKKPYTPELATQIRKHYGDQLAEIINETLANN